MASNSYEAMEHRARQQEAAPVAVGGVAVPDGYKNRKDRRRLEAVARKINRGTYKPPKQRRNKP